MKTPIIVLITSFVLALSFLQTPLKAQVGSPKIDETQVLKWMQRNVPKSIKILSKMKKETPTAYQRELERLKARIKHFEKVRQKNPRMYERLLSAERLEIEAKQMAEQMVHNTDTKEVTRQKQALRKKLEKIFDINYEDKLLTLKELEKEIRTKSGIGSQREA